MSNTDAIASRQRDCRTSAKSRIESRSNSSYSAASWCSRSQPVAAPRGRVDDEAVGDLEQLPRRLGVPSGGSPGHQTVTGRSWTSSGATSADRCRPVSPPAVRKISSVHVSGRVRARQHAVRLDPRLEPRRPVRVRATGRSASATGGGR